MHLVHCVPHLNHVLERYIAVIIACGGLLQGGGALLQGISEHCLACLRCRYQHSSVPFAVWVWFECKAVCCVSALVARNGLMDCTGIVFFALRQHADVAHVSDPSDAAWFVIMSVYPRSGNGALWLGRVSRSWQHEFGRVRCDSCEIIRVPLAFNMFRTSHNVPDCGHVACQFPRERNCRGHPLCELCWAFRPESDSSSD